MSGLPLIEGPSANMTEEQRDLACRDMLDPYLAALANATIEAGWQPAEVAAVMLGHAVDAIRAGAGPAAAKTAVVGVLGLLDREHAARN